MSTGERNNHCKPVRSAALAGAGPLWIATGAELREAASHWQSGAMLAVDTEFVRERTYYARLGLLQVSDGERVWLLDMPALRQNLDEVRTMFTDLSIRKVLHSGSEDMEIFREQLGILPEPVADSQMAAAMLGKPLQIRYENLVQEMLGIALESGPSRSDWLKRPLSEAQLRYASNDVAWLPAVMQQLEIELRHRDRWHWLQEDMQQMVARVRTGTDASMLYRRVTGHGRLDAAQLARLQQLALWRDRTARELDLPRRFVIRDDGLLALAKLAAEHNPVTEEDILAIRELPPRIKHRYLPQWLALLHQPPEHSPEPEPRLSRTDKQMLSAMLQVVREQAQQLGIDPALLASRRTLTELLHRSKHAIPAQPLSGWRGGLLNEALRSLLGA